MGELRKKKASTLLEPSGRNRQKEEEIALEAQGKTNLYLSCLAQDTRGWETYLNRKMRGMQKRSSGDKRGHAERQRASKKTS